MNMELGESGSAGGNSLFGCRVTREMLQARTSELAMIAGRNSHQITQVDYERAKLELTGESDFDRQQAMLDLSSAVTGW